MSEDKMYEYKVQVIRLRTAKYLGRLYTRTVYANGTTTEWYKVHTWSPFYTKRGAYRFLRKQKEDLKTIDRFDRLNNN